MSYMSDQWKQQNKHVQALEQNMKKFGKQVRSPLLQSSAASLRHRWPWLQL